MTMKHRRPIGSLQVAPLCLGGNVFGWTADEAASFAVLDAYAEAGGNFLDSAAAYSNWVPGNSGGESETIIGNWMAARGNRDDIVVATKIGWDVAPTAAVIRKGIESSLRRLRTDYVDLYYPHKDRPEVPVAEIVETLDELVQAGKVREIAVSNISAERLEASLTHQAENGLARYVAIQPPYNLVRRDEFEGELRDTVAEHGLAVIPYSSLASGYLTGKYRPGATVDSPRAGRAAEYAATQHAPRALRAAEEIAERHGTQPAAVALAWLAAQPTITATLASARSLEQLPPLLAGAELELSAEELATLTEASTI